MNDLAKAKAFYAQTLGLQVVEEDVGLRLHLPGGGTTFAYPKDDHQPATFTLLDFVVDELKSRGVSFERYTGLPQDEKGNHARYCSKYGARYSMV